MKYYEQLNPGLHSQLNSTSIRGAVAIVARFARRLVPRYALASDVTAVQLELMNKAIEYAERFVNTDSRGSGYFSTVGDEMSLLDSYPADAAVNTLDSTSQKIAIGVNGIHDVLVYGSDFLGKAARAVPDLATAAIVKLAQGDLDGSVITAAHNDFELVANLDGNKVVGQFGEPFNADEKGPLGSLWAGPPPNWFTIGQERITKLLATIDRCHQTAVVDSRDSLIRRISDS